MEVTQLSPDQNFIYFRRKIKSNFLLKSLCVSCIVFLVYCNGEKKELQDIISDGEMETNGLDSDAISEEFNDFFEEDLVETEIHDILSEGELHGEPPVVGGCRIFPPDNPWNTQVANFPIHPKSDDYIASIGYDSYVHPDFGTFWQGAPSGIPYVLVPENQPMVEVSFEYAEESDPGPYPIPADAPIEGGPESTGDRHVIVLRQGVCILYELFSAYPQPDGSWMAGSGAIWHLDRNEIRPAGWTSADAAGLAIFPGLVKYEETVEDGEIKHAIRVTVRRTQDGYILPASHAAGSCPYGSNCPPMGLRLRLKSDFDISPFPPVVQVILIAMKKYGLIVADNGSDMYISGSPDPRWDDDALHTLHGVKASDFEVVYTGEIIEY